jgi:hypothetical protein
MLRFYMLRLVIAFYDEAMKEIERMEKTGKSVVQCLSDKNGGTGEGC